MWSSDNGRASHVVNEESITEASGGHKWLKVSVFGEYSLVIVVCMVGLLGVEVMGRCIRPCLSGVTAHGSCGCESATPTRVGMMHAARGVSIRTSGSPAHAPAVGAVGWVVLDWGTVLSGQSDILILFVDEKLFFLIRGAIKHSLH